MEKCQLSTAETASEVGGDVYIIRSVMAKRCMCIESEGIENKMGQIVRQSTPFNAKHALGHSVVICAEPQ